MHNYLRCCLRGYRFCSSCKIYVTKASCLPDFKHFLECHGVNIDRFCFFSSKEICSSSCLYGLLGGQCHGSWVGNVQTYIFICSYANDFSRGRISLFWRFKLLSSQNNEEVTMSHDTLCIVISHDSFLVLYMSWLPVLDSGY